MRLASLFNYHLTPEIEHGFSRHLTHGRWAPDGDLPEMNRPLWRGTPVGKFPGDLILYHQAIYRNRPDWIIETGSAQGGSALFLGDMCDLIGHGQVITIDRHVEDRPTHPRVRQFNGNSARPPIVNAVSALVRGHSVMVTLDSDHREIHVGRELAVYAPLVTDGQYLVVEDAQDMRPGLAYHAVESFLANNSEWERVPVERQFLLCVTRLGWLRRKAKRP
jgi:cephalosporin hydroxylase